MEKLIQLYRNFYKLVKLLKSKDPITGQEYNSIFVIIDKFTKQGYFIAYIEEILAEDIAQVYIKEVFTRHRALDKIILNKNTQFISAFQQVFIAKQGIKIVVLTAYHPQTDGQTERLN